MAGTTLTLPDANLTAAYQKIYESTPVQQIDYSPITLQEQTMGSIADQVQAYLRPYYDQAITQRQATAVANRAELDADAYSRGMGSSTWLTDKKSREAAAAASDISSIEGKYGASLAEAVQTQFANYTGNKLTADQFNASNKLSVDEWNAQAQQAAREYAYAQLMDMFSAGLISPTGSGSGGSPDDLFTNPADYQAALATLKTLGVDSKTGVDYLLSGKTPTKQGATEQPDNSWIGNTLNG